MVKRELASQGVRVEGVMLLPGMRTPSAFIEVDSKTGERTIYYSPGRMGPIDEATLGFDPEAVRGAKCLLVDSLFPRTAAEMARVAQSEGAWVVADLFRLDGPAAELVPLVDALIIPEEAGVHLAGGPDFGQALWMMARLGPQLPAITVGARGCWYLAEGSVYHCPSFQVQVVDTTGCGDSFHGAFAFALSRGLDAHESVRFSSAVAALKATKLGGRSGLPTFEEVTRFLDDRPDEARAQRVE
jgi:sugar/nucleoside kinase (ribokinase family)